MIRIRVYPQPWSIGARRNHMLRRQRRMAARLHRMAAFNNQFGLGIPRRFGFGMSGLGSGLQGLFGLGNPLGYTGSYSYGLGRPYGNGLTRPYGYGLAHPFATPPFAPPFIASPFGGMRYARYNNFGPLSSAYMGSLPFTNNCATSVVQNDGLFSSTSSFLGSFGF